MKSAIYVEDGLTQVVLTPETEAEKMALKLAEEGGTISVYRGSFYGCRGGWTRHMERPSPYGSDDESLILVCRPKETA